MVRAMLPLLRVVSSSSLFVALLLPVFAGGLVVASCSNYADMLQRGQGYYEQNEYERALSVWRHLDHDLSALGPGEKVRFYYLRGMTDYRLGYRSHARYWLGLAKVSAGSARSALQEDEVKRMTAALDELNREVFGLEPRQGSGTQVLGDKCSWTSECEAGFVCADGVCIQATSEKDPAKSDASQAPEASDQVASSPSGKGSPGGQRVESGSSVEQLRQGE